MERCTGTLLTPERPRNSIHRRTRSLRSPASLLSTFPASAGVAPKTSRSIKPRERDLRDLRLFVLVRFLRGQRTILDMPPALPTTSRSQYAPTFGESIISAVGLLCKPAGVGLDARG